MLEFGCSVWTGLSSGALAAILRLAMVVPSVIAWALVAAPAAELPPRKYSPVERMQTAHLKATHEDAIRLQQHRRTLHSLSRLHDCKAILHAHVEDSAHTGGTRPEMLADAKKAGVQIIMLTDHYRPPRDFVTDSWRGLHDGVLFIPGAEVRGFLVYPQHSIMNHMDDPEPEFIKTVTQGDGLIFLSHIEERKDHAMDGLTGMEICNRHYDAKKDALGVISVAMKLLNPEQLAQLQENVRLYPDELLASQVDYPQEYMNKWDAETQKRQLTGIAANDCHHNQVLILKMVDENTVLLGTIVDKDEDMRRFTADSHPGIRTLAKGHHPGDILARVDLDPYYRSFRDMATHILAPELAEAAIRSALKQGHAYVSQDWMCDAIGFSFVLAPARAGRRVIRTSPPKIMGDEAQFVPGLKLAAQFPVTCHIRLLRNGHALAELDADKLSFEVKQPGVYRIEGWLELDSELRPWIYSNPIYVRSAGSQ